MINVTATAEEYLSELISKKDFNCDIRIFVSDPGTPRAETCLAFCKENESEPTDHKIKYENFTLFIEEKSLAFLNDAEVNYDKDNFEYKVAVSSPKYAIDLDRDGILDSIQVIKKDGIEIMVIFSPHFS